MDNSSTIAAIATSPGMGAIAVIRLSGPNAIAITDSVFRSGKSGKKLVNQKPYTIHYGSITDGNRTIDDVLVSLFRAPHSYTGEDVVEISCHGSVIIQQQILELLIRRGATLAEPGEFTLRAFLNGKLDLSQAEAIADLIASTSETARRVAMQQMRGGFSEKLKTLRNELLRFTALIELELDFGEEDVEFADRAQLRELIQSIQTEVSRLISSFSQGNAIKNGIPVAIAGKPNVGKSTLLNTLLNEEKAIVSEIAGTTRDAIEDSIHLGGLLFRFIDTAGLRHSDDTIEAIGIERALEKIGRARIVLYLLDATEPIGMQLDTIHELKTKLSPEQKAVILLNKHDKSSPERVKQTIDTISRSLNLPTLAISAKHGDNIEMLTRLLIDMGKADMPENEDVIVTNARHYQALQKTRESLKQVSNGLESGLSGDLLTIDIREAIDFLGEITGEITTDEVLGYIFSKFCIGK